jgi:hypothetical protein
MPELSTEQIQTIRETDGLQMLKLEGTGERNIEIGMTWPADTEPVGITEGKNRMSILLTEEELIATLRSIGYGVTPAKE